MATGKTEGRTGASLPGGRGAAQSPAEETALFGRVRDRVSHELNARKDRASEVIQGLAGSVRRIGEPLHDESLDSLAKYADEAASRLEQFAGGLRDRDVSELADDARRLARQHPGVFAAAGFAAGLAAARFFKSTSAGGRPLAAAPRRGPRDERTR
jgi:hypothetical protein